MYLFEQMHFHEKEIHCDKTMSYLVYYYLSCNKRDIFYTKRNSPVSESQIQENREFEDKADTFDS